MISASYFLLVNMVNSRQHKWRHRVQLKWNDNGFLLLAIHLWTLALTLWLEIRLNDQDKLSGFRINY